MTQTLNLRKEQMPIAARMMEVRNVRRLSMRAKGDEQINDSRPAAMFDLVLSAGGAVRRFDFVNNRFYMEELVLDESAVNLERMHRGISLLDSHWNMTVRDVLGIIEEPRFEQGVLVGTATMSRRADVAGVAQDIEDGVLRHISVGYTREQIEMLAPVEEGGTWVYRVTGWTPHEGSIVPIPADMDCQIRGQDIYIGEHKLRTFPCQLIEIRAQSLEVDPTAGPEAVTQRKEVKMSEQDNQAQGGSITTAVDVQAQRAQAATDAARAERERVTHIHAQARSHSLGDDFAQRHIDAGTTQDAFNREVLTQLAARSASNTTRSAAHIETVRDESETRRQAMADAILHRMDATKQLPEHAREYRYKRLRDLAEMCVRNSGVNTANMPPLEIVERSFHSTSDFTSVLANVASKRLRNQYEENLPSYTRWARRAANAPDFKPINVVQLSNAPDLLKVNETGEIKFGEMSDAGVNYAVLSYARGVRINRQAIINDDLNAFDRILPAMGAATRRLENRLVYAQLTSNPTVEGSALFSGTAGRDNLITGAGSALSSITPLGDLRRKMRLMKGRQGEELNLYPSYLIVPAALEQAAYQYTSSQFVPATSAAINEFRAGGRTALEPIVESVLDASSATQYYLAADPSMIDTVEFCYLDGYEGPRLTTNTPFDYQAVEFKVELDFATSVIDFRGLARSNGA